RGAAGRVRLFPDVLADILVLGQETERRLHCRDLTKAPPDALEAVPLRKGGLAVPLDPAQDMPRLIDDRIGGHRGECSAGVGNRIPTDLKRALHAPLRDRLRPATGVPGALGDVEETGDPRDGARKLARPVP